MGNFQVRSASVKEFAAAIEWAANEGWNPGVDDLPAFHAADPEGFLIGYLGDEPVSSISVVRYGESYGFLGFYIVKPGLRGSGYGWQTWQAGLEHLSNRTIGLDGVPAQQDNYRKSGFVLAGRNVRYAGQRGAITSDRSPKAQLVTTEMLDEVLAYDRQFFADDREGFMRQWLHGADAGSRWGVAFLEDDSVQGLGAIRQCRNGYKIGPLFAEHTDIAQAIIAELCESLPDDADVIVDVPEANQAAVDMVQAFGFEDNFETARMYKGTTPNLPTSRTFGVTTFELG
ncbi:MAG: GNAT family N-acetyltransferase [Pseudomonadota bacterium]